VSLATPADTDGTFTGTDARRSTRIERAVPLIILGHDRFGQPFEENTSAVSLNLHGCCYPSRHDYRLGTWVGLQVADPNGGSKLSSVRAQVRSIVIPPHARELYQIGVELEAPANVWGVTAPPEDWLHGREGRVSTTHIPLQGDAEPGAVMIAPELPRAEESATPEPGRTDDTSVAVPPSVADQPQIAGRLEPERPRVVITSDQLVAAMRGKLQRAAEKAVQDALTKSLEPAVRAAVSAIEGAGRKGAEQINELSAPEAERSISTTLNKELLGEFETQLAEFRGQWMEQQGVYRSQVEGIVQRLQETAAETEKSLGEARKFSEKFTREVESQLRTGLEESLARAGEEFEGGAARVADRQLLRLMEDSHRMLKEAASQLDARIAEARSAIQTASGATLDEFRRQAEVQVDLAASEVMQRVASSLGALDAENRAACEARRRALEQDVACAAEQSAEAFRTGIKAFLYSCLVAAVSAVDQHSRATLDGMVKNPGEAPQELRGRSASAAAGEGAG
jgi:hypothetical protein